MLVLVTLSIGDGLSTSLLRKDQRTYVCRSNKTIAHLHVSFAPFHQINLIWFVLPTF